MARMQTSKASELHFDPQNPRLAEYSSRTSESEILKLLWADMAIDELVMSILANGFFESEPLYVVEERGQKIVIEGNRRLAAVKSILHPEGIKGMGQYVERISDSLRTDLENNIPIVIVENREEAWRYIGFKHVKGAVKWNSYAKAQYIALVHNEYHATLDEIANQIGDSKNTVRRLFRGLMVLEQADQETEFKIDDIYNKRIYFSHLYTALPYTGFMKYLGMDGSDELPLVPSTHLKQLENVMLWLFGSRSQNIAPVITTQNPDLIQLNQVLQDAEAIELLKSTRDLAVAYDTSEDGKELLRRAMAEAKMKIENALAKMSFYDGNRDDLQLAKDVADSAEVLFDSMKVKYEAIKNPNKSDKRTID
ncbi:MAG: ParB N-terminal domain-containing protein [Bacteroidales bacterium]|nr:ParB N-terminal domain-containing protein [Bacteroidales bacterium]